MTKKGTIFSEEHRRNLSLSHLGQTPWNKGKTGHLSQETKEKISRSRRGKKLIRTEEGKASFSQKMSGPNNPRWVADRSQVDMNKRRNWSIECVAWREKVFSRDDYECTMSDGTCEGQLEAHHILSWKEYPEFRFEINNGITLCHAHHPRKRAEEKRLAPDFQRLVSVSKASLL